ncbi:Uncaracterized surface protein containing fasciclin (FAS1) repeats [Rhodovulum sp. ES.010]|uniref:fasciclin domain-containing protein n=1 Tax=Rhodovulum sp. ES.010 TaxID=1882821 RepID=UPI0009260F41|nr:fasciclin domain-containing protein [Rhodovulum sp. ES.010]SIO51016.1 Uncaracterized surface protein containing fasciclin (FAS1) repeats [Rhodovulum sp. ES.010]
MKRRAAIRMLAATGLAATLAACAPMQSEPDIVDIAASNEEFSTLVTAVQAAGLVDTLKGDGPFTVFAPTNAAFDALPANTVETLLRPENRERLVSVLTYHVVPGAVTSDQLAGQRLRVATVQGDTVHVDGTRGVRVNKSRVTTADIMASNGVIHVVDRVLLPPKH